MSLPQNSSWTLHLSQKYPIRAQKVKSSSELTQDQKSEFKET